MYICYEVLKCHMELERQYNKTNSTLLQLAALMHHTPIPNQH